MRSCRFSFWFLLIVGSMVARSGWPVAAGAADLVRPPGELPPQSRMPPESADLIQGFLPKEDLGVLSFLREHPLADGRGIIVAILDSGVDLAHAALQQTSTGEPKLIDVYDATDDGYVELPILVRSGAAAEAGTEKNGNEKEDSPAGRGLSGRTLIFPADIPDGTEIRLGILVTPDLFPDGLVQRRAEERRIDWDRKLQEWQAGHADSSGGRADAVRDELERIIRKEGDPGDRYDIAAIARGIGRWEVRIDTDADGDLTDETALHPFHEAREIARFPDPLNFSVAIDRIARDASSLFLFFDQGGHGTHVAGIVAGFYGPDDPLNGLAPGAQLIAAKVGNGRLGGASSHNSIMKAAQWAVDHGARVINLSFGGDTYFEDGNEEIPRFFNDLVERTGVVICASAGNNGPALSTIGAPATARRIFAWGASISKKTQQTNYGTLEPRREELFQFSSRGPLLSGDPGVDFISPGAALSTLPTWLLIAGESWNGTSMASPQGAGFCATVLSACREEGVPVTPERLRRAMRDGARLLPDVTAIEQGDGMPQAGPTLDALRRLADSYPSKAGPALVAHDRGPSQSIVGYVIEVANATGHGGGYYERDLREKDPYRVSFRVTPDFPRDSLQTERAAFLRIVHLASDVPWMEAPVTQSIAADGASIPVRIDPSKLALGLNVGRVVARDVRHPEDGPEFVLFATVIRPGEPDPLHPVIEGTWDLLPGDRRDMFMRVPAGATVARLRMQERLADPANAYEIALSAPDLVRSPNARTTGARFTLARNQEGRIELAVVPGSVLEVVAYSRWHSNRAGRLDYRLEFDGVRVVREPAVRIEPDRPGAGFVLGASSWAAQIRFDASINREIRPLAVEWRTRRDTLFTGLLAGLPSMVQTGEALISADAKERIELDLSAPPELEDILDDAFWRVFDDSGRIVTSGYLSDPPVAFEAPHTGVYRIRFSIYARGSDILDESNVIQPALVSRVTGGRVTVFRDAINGFAKGPDSLVTTNLLPGEMRRFFLRADHLPAGKLLRGAVRVDRVADDSPHLCEIEIQADTRDPFPEAQSTIEGAISLAIERAGLLAGRSDVSSAERAGAVADLERAERLRIVGNEGSRAGGGDRGRGNDRSKSPSKDGDKQKDRKGEKISGDHGSYDASKLWDIREPIVRLLLGGRDADAAEDALANLRESLPPSKLDPSEPEKLAVRRSREAIVDEIAAEIAVQQGDLKEGRKLLTAARANDPGVEGGARLEPLLLFREGKDEECRVAAAGWLDLHPDDREIDEVLVHSLARVGWWDLAALRLAGWPANHPEAHGDLLRLWEEVEAARRSNDGMASPFSILRP
jgi:subtilisin family serine protease